MFDLETRPSPYGHAETVARVEREIEQRGATVYSRVDHARNAADAGLQMPPTVVLTFGNPRGGTLVMLEAPEAAYLLPLHVLIREHEGQTLVQYRRPDLFAADFGIQDQTVAPLQVIDDIVAAAVRT
ncbi:hypothetical protein Pth03_71030 [Planotetraspora thailandica]|uniref:DUF302 domain-containing protein n=1 Tax=Planotetraspora thailandica TaxID=487172 RepID=A0A8J3Y0V5_9ACTN|nr:DUF302 domain-containing protein [Planotetraspora thailandica]GII58714.1 hypothetical protein Pth03_71030 [Planotetraspora thailandica]